MAEATSTSSSSSEITLQTESLLRLTWPIFLQHITGSVVLFVDFVFFGYLGDEVAGIIGQILPVTWLGSFIIPVFAGTGVSVSSQFLGAKCFHKVIPTYMMNLLFCVILGSCIAISMYLLRAKIGDWMGLSLAQNEVSRDYLGYMSGFFVILAVLMAYNAILSSRGLTKWIMVVSLISGVVNVVLNTWFVLGLGFEIRGIVGSTIIATFLSMLLSVYLVHGRLGIRFYRKGSFRDMLSVLRPMMKVGIPNVLEPASYAFQQIILSTFVIGMGVQSMASNAFASRLHMPHIVFGYSMAMAAQILMAHWMGAGKHEKINKLYWRVLILSVVGAWGYLIVIWSNAYDVLLVFTDNPEIRMLCKRLLLISLVTEPARMVNILSGTSLRALGDTRYPLIIGLIFIWGILPIIFAIDHYWTLSIIAMWVAFAVDEFVRALINIQRWVSGKWRTMGLVQ